MSTPDQMRQWARGVHDVEAGVELLIRSGLDLRGLSNAWDPHLPDGFSEARYLAGMQGMSGQQRRLAMIAANLLGLDTYREVDLGDLVTGLDRHVLHLALAALAHAGGSHQHHEVAFTDSGLPVVGEGYLPPLVGWPDPDRLG